MSPFRGPRRIALTGGMGTGKSYILGELARLGVPTIDADALAHAAVAPGTPGLAAVTARFGEGVLAADGGLNRAALAAVVFADPAARRDLEAIIHPEVRERIDRWFASLESTPAPFAVADIPLLYETGRQDDFDAVIVAACAPETQLARVMARDGLDAAAVRQRLAAQLPLQDKVSQADHVIWTDRGFADTTAQVRELCERLWASGAGR